MQLRSFFCSLLLIFLVPCVHAQKTTHVILISIDGLRPEMYTPQPPKGGAGTWPTPNLHWLMNRGTYAKHLKSVFPAYTYPSHTAMITGALPARSGIYFNQPRNNHGEWYWYLDSIKTSTLWQVLKKSKMTTASVGWMPTVGKGIDHDIPEIWNENAPDDRIIESRKYATPGLVEEIETNATGKLTGNNFKDESFSLDENVGRMASYIFKTYKPNFLALHVLSLDGMEHNYGREGDSVRLAVATDDRVVGTILQAIEDAGLKDSTAVIVVGDHGFSDIHEVFRVNMVIKDVPARFVAAGGSAFLYPSIVNGEWSIEKIIEAVKEKLNALPKDKRKMFRIVDRKELDAMGADSAAILALAAKPGLVFSGAITKAPVVNHGPGTLIQQNPLDGIFIPTHGGHHGYDPNIPEMYTGFIAYGVGIKKGNVIEELSEPDIAALIAKLLGVEFHCPDGKVPKGVLVNE